MGTHDTDYWTITERDGTIYQFGRNQLPCWTGGKPTTDSVNTQPVWSAHSGDPCRNATFSQSWCTMAYRWNLDYVTDARGNAMACCYTQDANKLRLVQRRDQSLVRPRQPPRRLDYGFRDGSAYGTAPNHAYQAEEDASGGDRRACQSGLP